MYSDFGAGALSTQLEIYRWEDHFSRLRAARAETNLHAQNSALQGLVQRLANYGRYVEQQHNSLLADAKRIDAQRCQQINAQLDEIDGLHREIKDKLEAIDNLCKVIAKNRTELSNLSFRKGVCEVKADQLERRVAELEAENAKLRQAEPSD